MMAVNDTTHREVADLRALLEAYLQQYDTDDEQHGRSKAEHLYRRDKDFTASDIAPPIAVAWYGFLGKQIRFDIHDDLRIFRHDGVAWTRFSSGGYGKSAGGDVLRTWVGLRDGEGAPWQILHEHGSSPRTTQLAGGDVM